MISDPIAVKFGKFVEKKTGKHKPDQYAARSMNFTSVSYEGP